MGFSHPLLPLLVVLAVGAHRFLREPWRSWALVAISLAFAASWGAGGLIAILLIITISYVSSHRNVSPWVSVPALVAVLAVFKYRDPISHLLGIPIPAAVGVSYFTFQAISYVVDVRRGNQRPLDLRKLSLLYAFFPKLVAGPIVRAGEMFAPGQGSAPTDEMFLQGMERIFYGVLKKSLIGDFLALAIVDRTFGNPEMMSAPEALVGAVGYTIQLYADFSGYTDMAVGLAMLMGYRLPENFDRPFRAVDLSDFWRRWHITLSMWLRDYVYIPLGGSRTAPWRIHLNLLVTFLVAGVWHGTGWTFVVWGLMHGAGLSLERLAGVHGLWRRELSPWQRTAAAAITFLYVALAFVFFRADSIDQALSVLSRTWEGPWTFYNLDWRIALAMVAGFCLQMVPDRIQRLPSTLLARTPWPVWAVAFVAAALVVSRASDITPRPFIYGGF